MSFPRASKVVAVHVNYRSRARERGVRPQAPSYFFKPPSSICPADARVERPRGTQLLTFEGEVALIIGTQVRRAADPAAGWSAVGAVTAALDLGLADLRLADRGSNVRSKGGDGYTPLGPTLLPADRLDPRRLRIRTWIDNELVQDDSTAELLFDFGYLVADLSRTMTLEPGDVILTGTPAGASVADVGDVIETEVVDEASGHGTGRLRSTVVDGPALAAIGAQPQVTTAVRDAAWGSPQSDDSDEATDVLQRARSVATATLSSVLRRRGFDQNIDGVGPLRSGTPFVGRARTLRMIAARPDLFARHGGGFNPQKQIFDTLAAGDVLVVEARGQRGTGTLGDILAQRALTLGAAGVVTDGGVRDSAQVAELGLPVQASGAHPAVLGRRHVPWEVDTTITCGDCAVQPGDLIVADDDGAVCVPWAIAAEVVAEAIAQEAREEFIAAQVRAGHSLDGLYPMNDDWTRKYHQSQEKQ